MNKIVHWLGICKCPQVIDYENEVKQLLRYVRKMNDGWTLTESELEHIESIKEIIYK